ncbi:MAG: hypothetical protein ACU0B9_06995 [Limimaricola soesokkakensis]|uniref:hypothetical protein n=1 Tax=Limimaricola soesokkakensis TaxID=1343159 RepID=UPI00405975D2
MGTITPTDLRPGGARPLAETTLTASDTLTFEVLGRQVLVLRNPTAGALSPVIDGDGATTVRAPGAPAFDISAGYAVGAIAAGAAVAIPLDSISAYLAGTITVTGGSGLVATLLRS